MTEREFTPEERRIAAEVADKLGGSHKKWLTEFAAKHDLSYEGLMAGAKEWIETGEYTYLGVDIDYDEMNKEFWDHYEGITAEQVEPGKRMNFFSCSC